MSVLCMYMYYAQSVLCTVSTMYVHVHAQNRTKRNVRFVSSSEHEGVASLHETSY